jgi:hypothetical protein
MDFPVEEAWIMGQNRETIVPPDGEDAAGLRGMRIGIKRIGRRVQIELQCDGDYQAIELYDRLVEGAQKGEITIDLKTR